LQASTAGGDDLQARKCMTDVSPGKPSADAPVWNRLHLGHESYSTNEIRCNLFRSNQLHLIGFLKKNLLFAPF
jgi:hypothetical protein